jgi:hypothetical protein
MRLDKVRYTVAPKNCDPDLYKSVSGNLPVYIRSGKKNELSYATKNYIHFMQGVRAMGGALVNTVFTTGFDKLQRDVAPDIEETSKLTTSDDSVRGVVIKRDSYFNHNTIQRDYINMAPEMVLNCMMKDSGDKGIESKRLAEFNNCVTGPNGMLPHQFIHAHLVIQPLTGETLIDDIISVTAQSRSALSWGDSIDLARSALDSYRILLQQRWFLTNSETDLLYDLGLLPTTDEELISGYHLRNDDLKLKLIRMVDEDTMSMIINDDISALNALRKYRIIKPGKPPKLKLVNTDSKSFMVSNVLSQINSARKVRGKANPNYIRTAHYKNRLIVKDNFISALRSPAEPASLQEKEVIKQFTEPPEVNIIFSVPRLRDLLPSFQGGTALLKTTPNMKAIMAKRLLNLSVTNLLTEEEIKISEMPTKEFNNHFKRIMTETKTEGFRFKSPGGLPLMRFHNDTVFTRPVTFQFLLKLKESVISKRLFTHNGIPYNNFMPCFWGNYSLYKCMNESRIPALGFSIDGDEITIFFKPKIGRLNCIKMNSIEATVYNFSHQGRRYYCPIKKDLSPIDPSIFGVKVSPANSSDITGDSIALLNYGNYLNTNAKSAFSTMNDIFETLGGMLIMQVHQHKPAYPYFTDSCITFPRGLTNQIMGTRSITKLKLSHDLDGNQVTSFDVTGVTPIRLGKFESTIHEMWE